MRDIPPEKYYEACLTYHFVRQFELIGGKLYPFSISQKKKRIKDMISAIQVCRMYF